MKKQKTKKQKKYNANKTTCVCLPSANWLVDAAGCCWMMMPLLHLLWLHRVQETIVALMLEQTQLVIFYIYSSSIYFVFFGLDFERKNTFCRENMFGSVCVCVCVIHICSMSCLCCLCVRCYFIGLICLYYFWLVCIADASVDSSL